MLAMMYQYRLIIHLVCIHKHAGSLAGQLDVPNYEQLQRGGVTQPFNAGTSVVCAMHKTSDLFITTTLR